MHQFFYPQNVAVIGVSDAPSNWGKLIIKNLIEFGFNGSHYAVGLQGASVYGKPIYKSLSDIPSEIDLAMVLVKAQNVPRIAEECGERGIKRLIISTAGFSEFRDDKKEIEDRLLDICRRYGMRFIGPNCMAVINMENGLFLPFGIHNRLNWQKGPVGIVSQSGTISMHSGLDLSYEKIGVSKVASVGNKLNVDEVDLLEYFLKDPETEIVFLHLEGLSRARKLCELASSADKPIIILKSNISPQSHGIAKSHTTSLASDEKVVDAAFRQSGIIRVSNLEELVDCAKVLLLPRLKGNRIACLSNGGGTAVTVADEAHRNGFSLPPLPQSLYEWLESKGRAKIITLTNPVDLGDIYDMDALIRTIEKMQELPDIDGVFYDLIYSVEWFKQFPYFQTFFDWCHQVILQAEKPVFLNISLDTKHGWPEVNKKLSFPFFRSISSAFRAMRQVMDAQ
jgi:acetate---CoA ligase (ADP-forming)